MAITQNKYIKTKEGKILIFDKDIRHDTFKDLEPISAGFAFTDGDEIICNGFSFHLDLSSDEEIDSALATKMMFGK